MLALLAAIPVAAMLITLGVLRWRAHAAAILAWALAALLAVTAFDLSPVETLSTSVQGFAYGVFPLVWILLTAIGMYEVTVASGRFDDLRRTFFLISDDQRVLGLLIVVGFGGLLESLSGFGAPVAITIAMLMAIGFSPLRAAVVSLLANTAPVALGGMGLGTLVAAQTAQLPVLDVAPVSGRLTAVLAMVVPFLVLVVMDRLRGLRQCWPIALLLGVAFAGVKLLVTPTPLYPLTELIGAVVGIGLALPFLRLWRPRGSSEVATEGTSDLTAGRIAMALVPYGLILLVFGVAAVPAVRAALVATDVSFAWPFLGDLTSPDGAPAAHRTFTFAWASTPGILLALVGVLSGLVYRLGLRRILGVYRETARRLGPTALTIGFVVALAYVMGDSGQTWALGLFVAGAGAAYPFLAPVLGWLGTYVTGSATSSNILFSKLQADVGAQLGGPDMQRLLVGANAAGGVIGKMISPQSLAIAATAIHVPEAESTILRLVLGWSIGLLVLMCVVSGLMSTPALSWLLPG